MLDRQLVLGGAQTRQQGSHSDWWNQSGNAELEGRPGVPPPPPRTQCRQLAPPRWEESRADWGRSNCIIFPHVSFNSHGFCLKDEVWVFLGPATGALVLQLVGEVRIFKANRKSQKTLSCPHKHSYLPLSDPLLLKRDAQTQAFQYLVST